MPQQEKLMGGILSGNREGVVVCASWGAGRIERGKLLVSRAKNSSDELTQGI